MSDKLGFGRRTQRPWDGRCPWAFRRESRLLGELIAAVPAGDTERAVVLARHLTWYEAGLTNHHHGEDELLWPLLYDRAGADATIVIRMERQTLEWPRRWPARWGLCRRGGTRPAATRRETLVDAISFHRQALIEHLDDEESNLLPLAARYLTTL